ncbi:hypothetical protein C8R44DRAFT_866604 [Mycena epipterygia]|nr:hypothetical protein C8R44DRAFT_866604 [Mycena epipterygia]
MSSPFTSKLRTSYCPKDEEVAAIQALLVEPAIRLQCLDDEIADLQKTIDKLAAEHTSIGAYEIFVACLPSHQNCVMSALEAPVLLGRICSSWRTISLSTPYLWARLQIVEPTRPHGSTSTSFDEKLAQRLKTTKMWLARSGQCPLSLSLLSSFERNGFPRPDTFMNALVPFASRWQHIHFTAFASELEKLSQIAATDVLMLHTLGLYDNAQQPHRLDLGLFEMLRGPQMSSFSILRIDFGLTELRLRWNQLTVLSLGTPITASSHEVLNALSKCPSFDIAD